MVIGGGDTGSDCIGTSIRQGANSVTQIEIMPAPPEKEDKAVTWPNWPMKMRTSSSQAEGAKRDFAVLTQSLRRRERPGRQAELRQGRRQFQPIPGTEFTLDADLVLLAMGFVSPVQGRPVGLARRRARSARQRRGDDLDFQTSVPKVFASGDMRRGQSLVVWAIREGRLCARAIDQALMGLTTLPK